MSAPIGFVIWFISFLVGMVVVGRLKKRPYYKPIMADETPLREGTRNWRKFLAQVHAKRLLRLVYWQGSLALLLVVVALAWEPATVLYAYYNATPTPAATAYPGTTAAPATDNEILPQPTGDPCRSPYPSDWIYPSECLP